LSDTCLPPLTGYENPAPVADFAIVALVASLNWEVRREQLDAVIAEATSIPILELLLPTLPSEGVEWIEAYRFWAMLSEVVSHVQVGPRRRPRRGSARRSSSAIRPRSRS